MVLFFLYKPTSLDADSFNKKIVEFVENGGIERYKQLRELIKNADTLPEADARPMPKFMNMQKDGIRRYSDENSRIAVMKNGDTFRLYDYDSRTVSKELTRTEVNAALREYNTKKNAVTSMNQENMQVTENSNSQDAIDTELLEFVDSVSEMKNKNAISKRKHLIGKISATHAKIIKDVLSSELGINIDVDGYTVNIDGSAVKHIEEKHGANGTSDSSMKDKDDVARIGWAVNNAENGYIARTQTGKIDYDTQYKNADGTPSPKIIIEKSIGDGKFIVAECVPDTEAKKIHIISARKIKSSNGQVLNVESNNSPQPTSKTPLDGITAKYSIPQETEKVNTSYEKNISKSQTDPKSAAELDSIAKENIPEYSKLSVPSRVMIRKVLYDALAAGYSESDAILFARVSARSGLHMTFSKSLCLAGRIKGTKDLVYADGYYDPYGNRIVINPEGTRSVDALLIHELTHAVYKDKRGRIILERGAKNMSDEQKQSIINSYSKVAKGSSAVIMDEMNAHYIEGQLKNKNLLEALLSEEPTLKDKILSFFKGASTDYAGNAELSGAAKRLFKRYKKLFDSFSAQNQGTNAYGAAVMNSAEQDGKRLAIQFLTDSDLDDYLKAGTRSNNYKQHAIESGKKILLTSEEEIKNYIKKATDGEKDMPTVAYGRVANKLSTDTESYSNGKIKISDYYLELVPNDLYHAYREHLMAKEHGDIDLRLEDFENIPEYLATYDDFVYAIRYKSGNTKICVSKKISNGRVLLIETVSKSHGSIEFKNLIGVSEEKYLQDYKAKYEKRNSTNTRGNESSNTSLRDATVSNNSIPQKSDLSTDISEKNSSKRFALPEGVDIEEIPDYNEKEYNDFGWARGNGILSKTENARLRSLFADAVSKQGSPYRTKSGEYMIAVGDIADNKIVYMKGTIDDPVITRILEIDLYDETELEQKRRNVYEIERRGIQRKTSGIFRRHNPFDIGYRQWSEQRKGAKGESNNIRLGADRRTGTGKAEATSKRITPYLPVVHTFTDISGRRRNVIRVDGKFMIEGNDHARYSATIEDAVSSENKRIIDRYARKYNSTAGIVRKKLTADPDFLKSEWKKGKRFALPEGDAALEELLAERDALESVENSFDAKAIISKGLPLPTGRENISRGELKKIIANNTADKENITT